MIENIIIGLVVVVAVILAIKYFRKGGCDCAKGCDPKKKPPCCK
ncbi:MAG: FeoB-associated Cys-rich membrane protein [Elusimicrobiota bacterium]|jgi:hypothetical protein|nr:FeoB-associated Cys-rich membrane protein [Elusimicrobiota bacterium]